MSGDSSKNNPRSAFTLVELLVVIAIIGLLISLVMPSLSGARERARQVGCSAKLRQMGVGLMLYAADHNGFKPALRLNDEYRGLWYYALGGGRDEPYPDGYLPNPRRWNDNRRASFWRCPAFRYPADPRVTYGMSRAHGYDRPMRMEFTTTFQFYNTSDPRPAGRPAANPSGVMVFGCGVLSPPNNAMMRRLRPPTTLYPNPLDSHYVWHDFGAPFVFLDGHVETRTLEWQVQAAASGPTGIAEHDDFWGHSPP